MECANKSEFLLTNYMDIFSLAQADADAHQECKREKGLAFFQSRLAASAENALWLLGGVYSRKFNC